MTRCTRLPVLCAAVAMFPGAPGVRGEAVTLRLLTHNVFGKHERSCANRAAGFGYTVAHAAPAYDVVAVQEYYNITDANQFTCDSGWLSDAIWCTGRYTQSQNYWRFNPEAEVFPLSEFDGGQGIFTLGSICDFHEWEFSYQQAGALQGVVLSRIAIPGTTITLDVYNVHIHARFADDCDRCCRKQELEELAALIAQYSRSSGNPVIVMGDFNTGGPPSCCGNAGYDDIMAALGSPRDLWLEANTCTGSPTMLCGNVADCSDETESCNRNRCNTPNVSENCWEIWPDPNSCASHLSCLNPPPAFNCPHPQWAGYSDDDCLNDLTDQQARIDFIFVLEAPGLSSSAFDVELVSSDVVNWTVANTDGTMQHVSDHFGVEATIQVSGPASVWVDSEQSTGGNGTSCNPYSSLQTAVTAVPTGGRVLLRDGLYQGPTHTIAKPCRLESIGGVAVIAGF